MSRELASHGLVQQRQLRQRDRRGQRGKFLRVDAAVREAEVAIDEVRPVGEDQQVLSGRVVAGRRAMLLALTGSMTVGTGLAGRSSGSEGNFSRAPAKAAKAV